MVVPFPKFISRCRYCGKVVADAKLADHIKNRCPKAPK